MSRLIKENLDLAKQKLVAGDLKAAEHLIADSLPIKNRPRSDERIIYIRLATVFRKMNNLPVSLAYVEKAIAIVECSLQGNIPLVALDFDMFDHSNRLVSPS